jgi:hypothetical protein
MANMTMPCPLSCGCVFASTQSVEEHLENDCVLSPTRAVVCLQCARKYRPNFIVHFCLKAKTECLCGWSGPRDRIHYHQQLGMCSNV